MTEISTRPAGLGRPLAVQLGLGVSTDYQLLLPGKVAELQRLARQLRSVARTLLPGLTEQLHSALAGTGQAWRGPAGDALRHRLGLLAGTVETWIRIVGEAADLLEQAARDGLFPAQRAAQAAADRFAVGAEFTTALDPSLVAAGLAEQDAARHDLELARARWHRLADQLADRLLDLAAELPREPSPWADPGYHLGEVAGGLGDLLVGGLAALSMLDPCNGAMDLVANPHPAGGDGFATLFEHPEQVARSLLDLTTLDESPTRWLTHLAPLGLGRLGALGGTGLQDGLLVKGRDYAVVEHLDDMAPHLNEVKRVRFLRDWSTWKAGDHAYLKPTAGEIPIKEGLADVSGPRARMAAAVYEVDQALGLGVVPETRLVWTDRGEASLQTEVAGRPLYHLDYPFEDRQRIAVLDYVTGQQDRHIDNYRTTPDGRPWAIDSDVAFPEGRHTDLKSDFTASLLNEPLADPILQGLGATDPQALAVTLTDLGVSKPAVDGVLSRLREVVDDGTVGGDGWAGRIVDGNGRVFRRRTTIDRP